MASNFLNRSLPSAALAFAAAIVLLAAAGCGTSSATSVTSAKKQTLGSHRAKLVVVGDIACAPGTVEANSCRQQQTADLTASLHPDRVLALGDLQYQEGTLEAFNEAYNASWGQFRSKTFPVPGNHEYYTPNATGYYDYFGSLAGDRTKGWHATTIGGWRVIGLNSNCAPVGGCQAGSAQSAWLANDLKKNAKRCTMALWHHPRFSTGPHGDNGSMADLWSQLQAKSAEVVFAGHDHDYERFAPMTSSGARSTKGLASFVVGTGGRSLYPLISSNPATRASKIAYGVLQLDLYTRGYNWAFKTLDGKTFDKGHAYCR
ncbi:MAG: alkaline phosphatase [Actinobacteria bacterium]|uniref:Unannotated protein n=1 Tax=freshwater metagenome TaxID=449393 RepID=A0A6J5ZZU6_9ZZZZ|nr:alkaline phosphatase [Actinomycetota bacterium]